MRSDSVAEVRGRPELERDRLTTYPSGAGPYRVFDGPSYDHANGPTHQAGVMPGHDYEPLRTPFGQTGTPGAGLERNLRDLDLAANRHPTNRNVAVR
ncbi:MAG TPA: hypothetical protein VKV26_19705 [Dehalococcoidia bacterium]|nr:hypothetical protein [Dehalococcoidia bacterium]